MSTALPTGPITPALQQGFNPNIPLVARFDFSISEITSLFTSPKIVLSALTGYYIHVIDGSVYRQGMKFDTQPGNLVVQVNTSTPFNILTWVSANSPLTQGTTTGWSSFRQFSNGGAFLSGVDMDSGAAFFGDKAIKFAALTGNPTVTATNTGSLVTLLLTYKYIPDISANIGSY